MVTEPWEKPLLSCLIGGASIHQRRLKVLSEPCRIVAHHTALKPNRLFTTSLPSFFGENCTWITRCLVLECFLQMMHVGWAIPIPSGDSSFLLLGLLRQTTEKERLQFHSFNPLVKSRNSDTYNTLITLYYHETLLYISNSFFCSQKGDWSMVDSVTNPNK